MNGMIEARRDALEELCRRFRVRRLELFGSAAGDRFDAEQSDFDFLVDFLPEAEPRLAECYLDLIAALRELLGREVDVVMLRAVRNPYFRTVIDRTRTSLYAA
ncbi:MAG: DNA polymerase III subunit beta [Phycisphaerales bacterium]|nr:DNA polymerase III subunit beta [Phycisphaerales bacterium]